MTINWQWNCSDSCYWSWWVQHIFPPTFKPHRFNWIHFQSIESFLLSFSSSLWHLQASKSRQSVNLTKHFMFFVQPATSILDHVQWLPPTNNQRHKWSTRANYNLIWKFNWFFLLWLSFSIFSPFCRLVRRRCPRAFAFYTCSFIKQQFRLRCCLCKNNNEIMQLLLLCDFHFHRTARYFDKSRFNVLTHSKALKERLWFSLSFASISYISLGLFIF